MTPERQLAILEDIADAQTLEELQALQDYGHGYEEEQFVAKFEEAKSCLKPNPPVQGVTDTARQIAELEAQIARLRVQTAAPRPIESAPRIRQTGKVYRLLKKEVEWTTTPQVHTLVAIIAAHVEVGGTITEEDIVRACVANEAVLETRQGGKRIWDYYKGEHNRGLVAHGNLEEVK